MGKFLKKVLIVWCLFLLTMVDLAFASISNLIATNDATSVSYSFTFTGTPTYLQIFLDTDRNSSTGFPFQGIGANYLIENGNIYRYTGTNGSWSWSSAGSSLMVRKTNSSSWTVLRASLGSPVSLNLVAATSAGDRTAIITQSLSPTWTRCAAEGGICNFTGTKIVRYGLDPQFSIKTLTGPVACNNSVFGDPAYGFVKSCEFSNEIVGQNPAVTTTTIRAVTTTTLAISKRDPLKQPFASNSIWNMPIGSNAVYVPVKFPAVPSGDVWAPMPQIDDDIIILRPTAPLTNIMYSDAGWSGKSRCGATNSTVIAQVPIPTDFIFNSLYSNAGSAILMADKRTIVSTQPFNRCAGTPYATSLVKMANADLYGDGRSGAHGGSYLSTIGGTIRVGELRPNSSPMKHALKVNVDSREMLARCSTFSNCYRWPAFAADSAALSWYGILNKNPVPGMKMGALLAIPFTMNLANLGLETAPGKQIAWTLQNYGAYIVDSTGGAAFAFSAEIGPDGSKQQEFQTDWGFPMQQRVIDNTPWSRDIQRLMQALHLVDNNTATTIGGGGTPRQPLAPPLVSP